jgi:hypothetical protein
MQVRTTAFLVFLMDGPIAAAVVAIVAYFRDKATIYIFR